MLYEGIVVANGIVWTLAGIRYFKRSNKSLSISYFALGLLFIASLWGFNPIGRLFVGAWQALWIN